MNDIPNSPCGSHFIQCDFNRNFQKAPGFQSQWQGVGEVLHLAVPEWKVRPEAYSSEQAIINCKSCKRNWIQLFWAFTELLAKKSVKPKPWKLMSRESRRSYRAGVLIEPGLPACHSTKDVLENDLRFNAWGGGFVSKILTDELHNTSDYTSSRKPACLSTQGQSLLLISKSQIWFGFNRNKMVSGTIFSGAITPRWFPTEWVWVADWALNWNLHTSRIPKTMFQDWPHNLTVTWVWRNHSASIP